MSEKLQELTEKLYKEGVEKARNTAKTILSEAEEQKKILLQEAQEKAISIVEKGQKDATDLRTKTQGELRLAARQAESLLKQKLITLLSEHLLKENIAATIADKDIFKKLIQDLMSRWTEEEDFTQITLVLDKEKEEILKESLKKSLRTQLAAGLVLEFSDRIKGGFRIEDQDARYALSFTDKDFEEYFRSFVKAKTRQLLFGEE